MSDAYCFLRPFRMSDIDEETKPVTYLWDEYLPAGQAAMLVAYAKTGKSTFLYPLLIAIARGESFLGLSTKQTNILLISEERKVDIKERFRHFGYRDEGSIAVHPLREVPLPFNTDETLTDLERFIRRERIGLIAIDTISTWWPDVVQDENDNSQVNRALLPLVNLTARNGVSPLFVHHAGKGTEGADTGKTIRGASALLAAVDLSLIYSRTEGAESPRRRLRPLGRYIGSTPNDLIIEYDQTRAEFRVVGDTSSGAAQVKVLAALQAVPPGEWLTVDQVTERSGGSAKSNRAALEAHLTSGKVERAGTGHKGDAHRYRVRP